MGLKALVPVFFLFGLLGGCDSMQLADRGNLLNDTLRAYEGSVRWGNLTDAWGFLDEKTAKTSDPPKDLSQIKVTRYEALGSPRMQDNLARQNVRISYIHQDRQVVQTLEDHQEWRFIERKGWRRINPIPPFQ